MLASSYRGRSIVYSTQERYCSICYSTHLWVPQVCRMSLPIGLLTSRICLGSWAYLCRDAACASVFFNSLRSFCLCCVALVIGESGPSPGLWRFAWSVLGSELLCLRRPCIAARIAFLWPKTQICRSSCTSYSHLEV